MRKLLDRYKRSRPYSDYLVFGILLACAPLLVELGVLRFFQLTLIAGVIVYAIVTLGLNLLMGYGGLFSLGTAAFMGLGAYFTAFFTGNLSWGFLPSIIVTVAITAILGMVVGLLASRVEGFFLAMATLAVAEILRQVFIEWTWFTNSFVGARADFPTFFSFTMNRNQTFVLLVVFLVIAMFVTHSIANSYTGRALSAMRGSEAAAAAMGINIFKYRIVAFSISTAYAGLGGALLMHFIRFTEPNAWIFTLSLMLFAAVVIGGVRSVSGSVLGAFVVFGVPPLILQNLPVIGDVNGLAFIFTGVLIIIVAMYYPAGLVYVWHDLKKLVYKARAKWGRKV
ncbi:MAG: branched-chain amino acid ABC transporter permease [Defluviitaleaceae bacterium]|nr:branched-chain amino acid ABC transporter permease [Defluviitaleaceae bacterium]